MYNYFTYNNNKSLDILNTNIFIVNLEREQEQTPFEREILRSEKTSNRYISKAYGSKHNSNLTFSIGLVKENLSEFSLSEISIITSWLYDTSKDMKLEFHCEDFDNLYYYMGQFKSIKQIVMNGTACLSCTFECDSQFAYEDVITSVHVNGFESIKYDCNSDLRETLSYPVLKISPKVTGEIIIQVEDLTGNIDGTMLIQAKQNLAMEIDCSTCVIKDSLGGFIEFEDLGLSVSNDIYWPQFYPGDNKIVMLGEFDITIEEVIPRGVGVPTWY